jgi:integrase
VHLTRLAIEGLREHHAAQDAAREFVGDEWRDHNLVFATAFGAPLDGTNVARSLHQTLERHGLRRIGLHGLRHSAASLMISEGVPMKVVQEILGHSSYTLTANTYSHIAPELQRDAANRLDSGFGRRTDMEVE